MQLNEVHGIRAIRGTGVVRNSISVSAPDRTVTMLTPIRRILAKSLHYQAGTTIYVGRLQGSKGSQGGASATEPFGVLGQA
jgi:hypothetical protein